MFDIPKTYKTIIPITDDRGRLLVQGATTIEPEPSSVVLVNGETGMAWQRHFDDGLWHSTRPQDGKPRDWANMLTRRNLVLVYDAEVRS